MGIYVANFDDKIIGKDPLTEKKIPMDEINGLAMYKTATTSIDFKSENSLGLSAVLYK